MLEQVLVIGDQTTRRLLWAHVLRLFNNEDLIKTKLGTAYAAGHFHTQMKHQSVVIASVDDKRGSDKGTYRSLIDAIDRSNARGKKSTAAFDPIQHMLSDTCSVYVVGFALRHFGMSAPSDQPTRNAPPENWGDLKLSEQAIWFNAQLRCMIGGNGDKSACCGGGFWSFRHDWTEEPSPVSRPTHPRHFCPKGCGTSFTKRYSTEFSKHVTACQHVNLGTTNEDIKTAEVKRPDSVYQYSRRLTNELLLVEAYRDCIRFGNGPKMIEIQAKWIPALCFIHSTRSHYTYEGLVTGAFVEFLGSPRLAHKMTWNATCCGHNKAGERNPGDYRLENVNRTVKQQLDHKGHQNLKTVDLDKLGRSILPLHDACQYFDQVTSVARQSPYCNTRRRINVEDEQIMLDVCSSANVFQEYPPQFPNGRTHREFENINANPFDDVDVDKLRHYVRRWQLKFGRWQRSALGRLYPPP